MYKVKVRKSKREQRRARVRKKIFGTASKPRMSVFRSNKYIYVQLIDDEVGKTLVSVSKEAKKLHEGKRKTEAAYEAGKLLAEKAKKKKISSVVFDRSGYKYHGRVQKIAEGAREGGIIF